MAERKPELDGGKSLERAQLNPYLKEKRSEALTWQRALRVASDPDWYVSVWLERRSQRNYSFNDKQDAFKESLKMGLVLRIFDGLSFYEEAMDDWACDHVESRIRRLVARVREAAGDQSDGPFERRPYRAPSWPERLQRPLDPEITCQIPADVNRDSWVHFATPLKAPIPDSAAAIVSHGKELLIRMRHILELLPPSDPVKAPDFLQTNLSLAKDDFLFVDDEVCLSQTVLYNYLSLMAMKAGENGRFLAGGMGGWETLQVTDQNIEVTFDRLRACLQADRLTPGRYRVLMSPAVAGLFAHEAFGHSQEGDTWARGRSQAQELYASQVRVGNEHATILNNPAVYHNGSDPFAAWGSYYFDEEGWFAEEQVLVREGYLQPPMTNLASAVRLGFPRTANGKREAWTNAVYARQTNTYFSAGDKTLEELFALMGDGYLAAVAGGGMEDPRGMGIQVGVEYLEEVRNGQLTGRIFRGPQGGAVQITGYVPDYLRQILAKSKIDHHDDGKDQSRHPWNEVGGCGKYHKELVRAGSGGPYLLIDDVLLG